jgi:hypothetical protein
MQTNQSAGLGKWHMIIGDIANALFFSLFTKESMFIKNGKYISVYVNTEEMT